jgi:TRAP-type C4-dicarboxylate transport system permease small subunit
METFSELAAKIGLSGRAGRMIFFGLAISAFGAFLLWEIANILSAAGVGSVPDWLIVYYVVGPKLFAAVLPLVAAVLAFGVVIVTIFGLQRESRDYARKISRRQALPSTISKADEEGSADDLRTTIRELRVEVAAGKEIPPDIDFSSPERIFQVARQRLLDEAVRLDSISRRNLMIGILFSAIALGVLAWPLIAASFQQVVELKDFSILAWASQYYLPRFAVGILLQFVGFFFLRLYVANELDLKHNKNEITNFEMKMIGVQLAQSFGDAPSKKEIVRSLAATERNFLIKKNERTISTEAITEYNDMKGLLEKIVNKLPGKEK